MNKIEQIKELKALLDSGLINNSQYNQLLNEIVGSKSYEEQSARITEDSIVEKAKRFAIGIKNNEDRSIMNAEDKELLLKLPYVIAYPLQQTLLEKNAPQRLNYFRDTFLNYLKFLGLLTASEFFNSPFKERKIVDLFSQNLAQPSFGSWNAFTRECLTYLKTQNHTFFCPDLVKYYETVETGKKRKMYKGEIEVVDSYNGGETRYIKQQDTGIGMLINFRNRYLGHGLTLSSTDSEKLWNDYFPIFRTLLEQLTFCEKFPMLKQESGVYYSLQGIEIKPFKSKINIDSNVAIYNSNTNTSMPIIPFFIIPGELAIDRDEKANIMSYESNNGKTITFFSPEGITKQTSGKLLERLDLLLRDKQKEIPYTPETFTKDVFEARIAEENKLMIKSLLDEKKVIEGIYQHREEIEIKLREWIGARANIFFIAAEAGSGKTNLLVEMQRQYAERNLMSLFIRASRMEKPSLKEELCYKLNIYSSLDIAQYTSLAGTQEDPFFILIDGLNESSYAENIWQEILEISSVFEPGSLKFIITSRANTKIDIDRYVLSENQLQYIYGENKDHVKSLSGFAFWLTPLDMKEMESAWGSYVAYDRNRFKPLFSFNDIATFDRGLYLQINNPLVLRIFLETYKGKNLPKKGTKHLHVWKDWFATFSNEEQNFMNLLADVVWESGENELLLDDVLNNKNLQSYFLNDNSSAPYLRLLTLGWISRYVKDLTVYVSFTVEGLLLYLLGKKLNQQNPTLTSDGIGEILNNGTKLQKSAIESFLSEQALEGKIGLITKLIDEGEEKLELCVTPLLYFLKSQGVEKTIEKLLENPTENDWKVLLVLDKKLEELELHELRKEFFSKVMINNKLDHKFAIEFGLKAIPVLDEKDALIYIDNINHSLSFIIVDEYLLALLADCQEKIGNYNKSLELNEKTLALMLEKYSEDHPDLTTTYNHIGFAWDKKGKYEIALEYLNKGLTIGIKELGENDPSIATSYNNIGLVYDKKGEYNKALEFYEKSLEIYLKSFGSAHTHVATVYNNIGLTYDKKLDYYKTLNYLEKGLVINLKIFGHDHFCVGALYNNFGVTYASIGELDKAIEFYEKTLLIYSKSLGELHPQVATTYHNIGYTFSKKGELDIALKYYEKALAIFLKTYGVDHPDVGTTYNDIGLAYARKDELSKALIYYEKSLPIYLAFLDSRHPNVANLYDNIGNVLCNLGEYKKAIEYYEKCLHIRLERSDEEDLEGLYFDIGDALLKGKQYEKAIDYLLKAFDINLQGGYAYRLAKCFEELNQLNEAFDYYVRAAEIRKTDIGIEHAATQEAIANAGRIAKELNKEDELPDWMKK